jgi:transcriptional regulator with XRE-family HTH domain
MKFNELLERYYLAWQQREGRRKTVSDFAAHLGFAQTTVSSWLLGARKPEGENVKKLAQLIGMEVYDTLNEQRPDPDLMAIEANWPNLSAEERTEFRKKVEKLAKKK